MPCPIDCWPGEEYTKPQFREQYRLDAFPPAPYGFIRLERYWKLAGFQSLEVEDDCDWRIAPADRIPTVEELVER